MVFAQVIDIRVVVIQASRGIAGRRGVTELMNVVVGLERQRVGGDVESYGSRQKLTRVEEYEGPKHQQRGGETRNGNPWTYTLARISRSHHFRRRRLTGGQGGSKNIATGQRRGDG